MTHELSFSSLKLGNDHAPAALPLLGLVAKDTVLDREKPELYDLASRFIGVAVNATAASVRNVPIQLSNVDTQIQGFVPDADKYPLNEFGKLSFLIKERLDMQIENYMKALEKSTDPEQMAFYSRMRMLASHRGLEYFTPLEFIVRGTGTSTSVMQGLFGVVPQVLFRDGKPNAKTTSQIAQNSYPLAIRLARMHLFALGDTQRFLRIGQDSRLYSPYDPRHFELQGTEEKPYMTFTQEANNELDRLHAKYGKDKSNPGCPALKRGSIKKLWDLHFPVVEQLYKRRIGHSQNLQEHLQIQAQEPKESCCLS